MCLSNIVCLKSYEKYFTQISLLDFDQDGFDLSFLNIHRRYVHVEFWLENYAISYTFAYVEAYINIHTYLLY